jgi:hypothetical protein
MSEHANKVLYDIAYQRGRADEREALARGDSRTEQIKRCQAQHPEGGRCEFREGHAFDRHLAGMILWPAAPAPSSSSLGTTAEDSTSMATARSIADDLRSLLLNRGYMEWDYAISLDEMTKAIAWRLKEQFAQRSDRGGEVASEVSPAVITADKERVIPAQNITFEEYAARSESLKEPDARPYTAAELIIAREFWNAALTANGDSATRSTSQSGLPQEETEMQRGFREHAEVFGTSSLPALGSDKHGDRIRQLLISGVELVQSAFAHVSHGGPTRADAEKWLTEARNELQL